MPLHYYVASMIYVMHYLGLLCSYRPTLALSIHSLFADEVCKDVQQTRRVNHIVVIDVTLQRHPAL